MNLFTIAAALGISVIFFLYMRKKNQNEKKNKSEKDDIWYVIKEYLKKNHMIGYEVVDWVVYQRPKKSKLNKAIHEANILKAQHIAEDKKQKYIKPKREKFYDVEEYLLSHYEEGSIERKYIVCFRARNKKLNQILPWECIEIELFREEKVDKDNLFSVRFCEKLNYDKELSWIYPLQYRHLSEKSFDKK